MVRPIVDLQYYWVHAFRTNERNKKSWRFFQPDLSKINFYTPSDDYHLQILCFGTTPPPNKKILNKKHTNYVHVSISHLHKEPEILSLLKKATLHNNNKYIKKKRR